MIKLWAIGGAAGVLLAVIWASSSIITERNQLRSDLAAEKLEVIRLAAEAEQYERAIEARDKADAETRQELYEARQENADLAGRVADGATRLRIRASCPDLPEASGAPGVADGATVELDADARQDYFTLRDQLTRDRAMILGLQRYIEEVCIATF